MNLHNIVVSSCAASVLTSAASVLQQQGFLVLPWCFSWFWCPHSVPEHSYIQQQVQYLLSNLITYRPKKTISTLYLIQSCIIFYILLSKPHPKFQHRANLYVNYFQFEQKRGDRSCSLYICFQFYFYFQINDLQFLIFRFDVYHGNFNLAENGFSLSDTVKSAREASLKKTSNTY